MEKYSKTANRVSDRKNDIDQKDYDRYMVQLYYDISQTQVRHSFERLDELEKSLPMIDLPYTGPSSGLDSTSPLINYIIGTKEEIEGMSYANPNGLDANEIEVILANKINILLTIRECLEVLECYTKKNSSSHKNYVQAKYYQALANLCLKFIKYRKASNQKQKKTKFMTGFEGLVSLYSKVVMNLEHSPLHVESDQFFSATLGSHTFSIAEKYSITETYLEACEALGDYGQLQKVYQKWDSKTKSEAKDNQSDNKSSVPASVAKNVDKKLHKKIFTSMLKALLTCITNDFQKFVIPEDNSKGAQSRPLLITTVDSEIPPLIKETLEIYTKYIKKKVGKGMNQKEKDILYECLFKLICIYGGAKNQRYLLIKDPKIKEQGAQECYEYFKQKRYIVIP